MIKKPGKHTGRKPIDASDRQKRRNITLSDRSAIIASRISGGSVSKGIRIALDAYYENLDE